MLVRVNGAREGIRDYLENGHKSGRALHRDVLDQRVELHGDLAETDQIIREMDIEGEKYLHITLGFKEDEVSHEVMRDVLRDFEEFAFSAYKYGEYNYYAEAHLPKVKSYKYSDKETGELKTVIRKPHIHIVVPKINMWSGHHLNPFGFYKNNERFVEAFQEYTNQKYGFLSPKDKDSRRTEITSASEMIARQVDNDEYQETGRELKIKLRAESLERGITTYEEFKALAAEFGEVKIRNEGKADEHLWLKPNGEARGVNLRNYVFRREYFESGDAPARARDAAEMLRRYDKQGMPRQPDAALAKTLAQWHELNAAEIKYMNSGSGEPYKVYKRSSRTAKLATLAERRAAFYDEYEPKDADHEQANHIEHRYNDRIGRAREQDAIQARRLAGNGMHKLSERRLANRKDGNARLARVLQTDVRHRGRPVEQLRRSDAGLRAALEEGGETVGRPTSSVLSQLIKDEAERTSQARANDTDLFKTIKRELGGDRLLSSLSHPPYSVIPEKYEVTKGKDGSDRIRAGDRNLNVSDFLTKELHLSWKEAAPILREAYQQQQNDLAVKASQEPSKDLWRDFTKWDKARLRELAEKWKEQKASEPARRKVIRDEFREQKQQLEAQRSQKHSGGAAAIRAAVSVLRMERVHKEMSLRDQIDIEREALREEKQRPLSERYRLYLLTQAQAADARALAELRRLQAVQSQSQADDTRLQSPNPKPVGRDRFHDEPALSYTVERNGDVTYARNDQQVIVDRGQEVTLLQHDDETIEIAMRFAVAKWGAVLDMSGTEEQKRRAAELAAEKYMKVTFADPSLNAIITERKAQMGREHVAMFRELGSTQAVAKQQAQKRDSAKQHAVREQQRRDMARREGLEPPTTIIAGENFKETWPIASKPRVF